jgi:hypothetical protein
LSRREDEDDVYASEDDKVFAGFSGTEDRDQLSLLGMRELDEYSAVKFNLRSSRRDKLRLHQERDILLAEVMEFVRKRVKPPHQFVV